MPHEGIHPSGPLMASVTYVNETEGYRWHEGDEEVPESSTLGELYRNLRAEHGKAVSKVYIGEGTPIGWVFQKRQKYDDSDDTFLAETWVSFFRWNTCDCCKHTKAGRTAMSLGAVKKFLENREENTP